MLTKRKLNVNFQHQLEKWCLLVLFVLLTSVTATHGQVAFPGAEGYGANTIGGRGGQIIKVTNLNDSGSGSFREAVTTAGSRIVVFEVSGIINLESGLTILEPYLTIAGHTSPGGILVTGYSTLVNTHEVIIRHMRFRVGSHRIAEGADPETLDSFGIWGRSWGPNESYNIIVDHCSFSWGVDETFSVSGGVENLTIQNSIISEGLMNAGHPKGEHSKGLMISGKYNDPNTVSIHHNYIAHNTDRNPLIYTPSDYTMTVDVVNNVVYNWKGGLSMGSEGTPKVNWVHNYAKQGASSNSYSFEVIHQQKAPEVQLLYVNGNIGSTRLSQTDPQWNVGYSWRNEALPIGFQQTTRWSTPAITTTTMSDSYANEVLSNVGATLPVQDAIDIRVINDFINTTGDRLSNVVFPDDFPTFQNLLAPIDTDNDGMPDNWENANGLNPSVADNNTIMASGYTAIEEYINELAGGLYSPILSTNDSVFNNNIVLFPNPASDSFTVSLESDMIKKIIIYNELGKQVKEEVSNKIDISSLPSAIYYVQIISKNGRIAIKKVIKE